jgi:hypothetical protein
MHEGGEDFFANFLKCTIWPGVSGRGSDPFPVGDRPGRSEIHLRVGVVAFGVLDPRGGMGWAEFRWRRQDAGGSSSLSMGVSGAPKDAVEPRERPHITSGMAYGNPPPRKPGYTHLSWEIPCQDGDFSACSAPVAPVILRGAVIRTRQLLLGPPCLILGDVVPVGVTLSRSQSGQSSTGLASAAEARWRSYSLSLGSSPASTRSTLLSVCAEASGTSTAIS